MIAGAIASAPSRTASCKRFLIITSLLRRWNGIILVVIEGRAVVFNDLNVRFQTAIEQHLDAPRPRVHFGIFKRGSVANGVAVNEAPALHQMQLVAIEVPYAIQPRFPVEIGHVHHQGVALPVATRVPQPEVDVAIRVFGAVGIDGSNRMTELIEQGQVTGPLEDLERLAIVDAARRPEREALGSWIGGGARGGGFRAA